MATAGRYQPPQREALRRSSRPIVLRWRPKARAMAAGDAPWTRSTMSVYLSGAVIWRYIMAGFLLLAETEVYRIPGHLPRSGAVLHLVYESAAPNNGVKLTSRGTRFRAGGLWRRAAAARSLSAVR